MTDPESVIDKAIAQVVDLGNRTVDADPDADLWDVADGMLAGAIQFWLYSRQPCGDPRCEDCQAIDTAETRYAELVRQVGEFARDSEYFHSPLDTNVGRA